MKKILITLIAVCAASVFAADALITGVGSNYTGVGTFQVTSDGSKATLTVDEVNILGTAIQTVAGGVTGSSTVATNITPTYVTNTIIYLNASTNVATNVIVTATYAAQTSAIKFVSGVCTNKP